MVILERRNTAGKVAYKTLEEAWQGSKEDNFILLDLLDQLRTDPGLLSSETVLADLNDELAPVSARPFQPRYLPAHSCYSRWLYFKISRQVLKVFSLLACSTWYSLPDSAQDSVQGVGSHQGSA